MPNACNAHKNSITVTLENQLLQGLGQIETLLNYKLTIRKP